MTTPDIGDRGDIVVQVEFDPTGAAGVYTNWCGATNFGFKIANEINKTVVGDCDDWGLPLVNKKSYGAQDVTANMDATWTAATHAKTQDWALSQLKKKVRILFPNATSGQVSMYDGTALLAGLDLDGIANLTGDSQTETVSLEFDGAVTPTLVA